MNMYIPALVVVLSNVFYHICAKSTPAEVNTFASLSVTYLVGAAASLVLYFISTKDSSLVSELHKLNWTSFVLGLAIIGLEAGFLFMYKLGWDVSTGQIVTSAALAVVLIFVGWLLYRETMTFNKIFGIFGIVVCMIGLYFINK